MVLAFNSLLNQARRAACVAEYNATAFLNFLEENPQEFRHVPSMVGLHRLTYQKQKQKGYIAVLIMFPALTIDITADRCCGSTK
jgi:hypothetical protein